MMSLCIGWYLFLAAVFYMAMASVQYVFGCIIWKTVYYGNDGLFYIHRVEKIPTTSLHDLDLSFHCKLQLL